jgi:hypothetical protein
MSTDRCAAHKPVCPSKFVLSCCVPESSLHITTVGPMPISNSGAVTFAQSQLFAFTLIKSDRAVRIRHYPTCRCQTRQCGEPQLTSSVLASRVYHADHPVSCSDRVGSGEEADRLQAQPAMMMQISYDVSTEKQGGKRDCCASLTPTRSLTLAILPVPDLGTICATSHKLKGHLRMHPRRRTLQSTSMVSYPMVAALCKYIDAFIARYNDIAEPIVWTSCEVH